MNVLILEADPQRQVRFLSKLAKKKVFLAETPAKAVEILQEQEIDIAFMDHRLCNAPLFYNLDGSEGMFTEWVEMNKDRAPKRTYIHGEGAEKAGKLIRTIPNSEIRTDAWKRLG